MRWEDDCKHYIFIRMGGDSSSSFFSFSSISSFSELWFHLVLDDGRHLTEGLFDIVTEFGRDNRKRNVMHIAEILISKWGRKDRQGKEGEGGRKREGGVTRCANDFRKRRKDEGGGGGEGEGSKIIKKNVTRTIRMIREGGGEEKKRRRKRTSGGGGGERRWSLFHRSTPPPSFPLHLHLLFIQ